MLEHIGNLFPLFAGIMKTSNLHSRAQDTMRQNLISKAQLLCLFLALTSLGAFYSALAADKPNVIIVLTDDQGYGDIGAHGHPFRKEGFFEVTMKGENLDQCGPLVLSLAGKILKAQKITRKIIHFGQVHLLLKVMTLVIKATAKGGEKAWIKEVSLKSP